MRLGSHVAVAVAMAGNYSSDSTPSLGTFVCCGCGPGKTKKKKKGSFSKGKTDLFCRGLLARVTKNESNDKEKARTKTRVPPQQLGVELYFDCLGFIPTLADTWRLEHRGWSKSFACADPSSSRAVVCKGK